MPPVAPLEARQARPQASEHSLLRVSVLHADGAETQAGVVEKALH